MMRRSAESGTFGIHCTWRPLAEAHGLVRLLREQGVRPKAGASAPAVKTSEVLVATSADQRASGGGLLTPKEREVLTLLSRNLSNKEIALAMGIGEQTIKWHMKNLFSKLSAASRKHAVARARLLGLVGH